LDVVSATDDRNLRASDADRDAVAKRLQAAVDEGRLDLTDFDERLRDAYAARTYAELDPLTADLPPVAVAPSPALRKPDEKALLEQAQMEEWKQEWRSWLGGALIMLAIWGFTSLVTGDLLFFWPGIPIGIWAAVIAAGAITGEDDKKKQKRLKKIREQQALEKGE
jgi:hypothetical protein